MIINIIITADRAKSIKTQAVVNESPTDRLIRELREENAKLQKMMKGGGGAAGGGGDGDDEGEHVFFYFMNFNLTFHIFCLFSLKLRLL